MKIKRVDFAMTIEVYDEHEYRAAARSRALADGLRPEDADEYLDPEEKNLADCAVMLFDPGFVQGTGCDIEESTAEEY